MSLINLLKTYISLTKTSKSAAINYDIAWFHVKQFILKTKAKIFSNISKSEYIKKIRQIDSLMLGSHCHISITISNTLNIFQYCVTCTCITCIPKIPN